MFNEEQVSIYICDSGSREDAKLREKLIKHLPHTEARGVRHHDKIGPGEDRKAALKKFLTDADIILLLISPDFVHDEECRKEVEQAFERYDNSEVNIIPVMLRPANISGERYEDLKALPAGGPVTLGHDRGQALYEVAEAILQTVSECRKRKGNRSKQTPPPANSASSDTDRNILPPSPTPPTPKEIPVPLLPPIRHTLLPRLPGKRRQKALLILVPVLIVGLIAGLMALPSLRSAIGLEPTAPSSPTCTLSPAQLPAGLSLGGTIFDTQRADAQLKCEAANSFNTGHYDQAQGFLTMASDEDSSDAEALVYHEDLCIEYNNLPHVTLIVPVRFPKADPARLDPTGVDFKRDDPTAADPRGNDVTLYSTRATLQGVYVAQKEHNTFVYQENGQPSGENVYNQCKSSAQPDNKKILLLLANLDNPPTIQDIKSIAQRENIIGIVGRPLIDSQGEDIGESLRIPLVASQTSCTGLPGANSFSVAPPLQDVVNAVVTYASQQHAHNVAVYYDPNYPDNTGYYGNTCLKEAFQNKFHSADLVLSERYSTGIKDSVNVSTSLAKQNQVDFIYFLGPLDDTKLLIKDLVNIEGQQPVTVLGTNMLYQYVYAPPALAQNINGVYFTAFAFHDVRIWDCAKENACNPPFLGEYDQAFNPGDSLLQTHYGYTIPDSDAILAYDATSVLLSAYHEASSSPGLQIVDALRRFTPQHPFAGVSGQIGFASNGYPVDKAMLILHRQGTTKPVYQQGRYQ